MPSNSAADEADQLADALATKLSLRSNSIDPATKTLKKIAEWIEESMNILVLTGAGVSVSAGIPDFRTPKTGLYDNLQKYNLPYAEAVFDIQFYRVTPEPFVMLASEIWPSTDLFKPTVTHAFIKVLEDKKKLLRIYTQNIDGLEKAAGIKEQSLIECHGHFRSAHCIDCNTVAKDMDQIKDSILVDRKVPICKACKKGFVKPDIVFFGEQLPEIFETSLDQDLPKADMLLVMGTSLQVPPVANIPTWVKCSRRVLLNRERVGNFNKKHDLFHSGSCDDSVLALAKLLGWEDDVLKAYSQGQSIEEQVEAVNDSESEKKLEKT